MCGCGTFDASDENSIQLLSFYTITLSRRVGDNLINCMGFSIDFVGFMCCVVVSLENVTESKEVFPCLSY